MSLPVGLALYTVRDECAKDLEGTLRRVSEMGYQYVETIGTQGIDALELKQMLDAFGLKCCGVHFKDEDLTTAAEKYKIIGAPLIGWSSYPGGLPDTIEGIEHAVKNLNQVGRTLYENGLGFFYHNHAPDFDKVGSRYIMSLFLEQTNPAWVGMELDIFWALTAGADPLAFLALHPGRCETVHLKGMTEAGDFTEVGGEEDIIEWPGIVIPACIEAGVQYFVVEQDVCAESGLISAEMSFNNLREWGFVS